MLSQKVWKTPSSKLRGEIVASELRIFSDEATLHSPFSLCSRTKTPPEVCRTCDDRSMMYLLGGNQGFEKKSSLKDDF